VLHLYFKIDAFPHPKLKEVQGNTTNQKILGKVTQGFRITISNYSDVELNPNDALNYIQRLAISMRKNVIILWVDLGNHWGVKHNLDALILRKNLSYLLDSANRKSKLGLYCIFHLKGNQRKDHWNCKFMKII
jgi:hypothetical protein